ncbi:2376_t:CDS:2, partial [Cetraspora pellucida]
MKGFFSLQILNITEATEVDIDDIQAINEVEDTNSSVFFKEVVNSDLFKEIIRKCTYLYDHAHSYNSKSKKDTVTKKINCPFLINTSCLKSNNPAFHVYINKIVYDHNHLLSIELISFEESKKFTSEILKDIKFLTTHCKFEATVQYRFLEALLPDKSTELHVWMFNKVLKATEKQPAVIITDADPAIESAIHQIFTQSYQIYCAFHLTQNINKHLRNSLGGDYSKFIEAFYICKNSLGKETFEKRFKNICQNFPNSSSDEGNSNKGNQEFILLNSKKKRSKGHP